MILAGGSGTSRGLRELDKRELNFRSELLISLIRISDITILN